MSFADLLRKSRSSPTAVLHKFLVNYNPSGRQIHAFVEGSPDLAFYRRYLDPYVDPGAVWLYNCEGKAHVYETYGKIIERFPHCRRVIFFVDKDVDDIIGEAWPADPRIYVTDVYSIENYLVCKEVVTRYLHDFVKLKRVEFDFAPVLSQFDKQRDKFYGVILPLMAWVVTARRSGQRPNLGNIALANLLLFSDSGFVERKRNRLDYLCKVTGVQLPPGVWKPIRRTCLELKRLPPKRYVRGKFEAWFMLEMLKTLLAQLDREARQSGGAISVNTSVHDSNFVQLLVPGLPVPTSLASFLDFHLRSPEEAALESHQTILARAWRLLSKFLPK